MKKVLIVAAIAAQVLVLFWMGAQREWVARTGQLVYLRTAPRDPRDPMRGDYLRLNYELAVVPKSKCRDGVLGWFGNDGTIYDAKVRDRRVFAAIELDGEGVAILQYLSDQRPAQGLFLRGRANSVSSDTIDVRFGVEGYFMQQGKAQEFERRMATENLGVPLNMAVAVSSGGLGVLKSYRWEPLGITLTLDRVEATARTPGAVRPSNLRGLTVHLKNHGTAPLAIVDDQRARTLRLVPSSPRWRSPQQYGWEWVGESEASVRPSADAVKLLQPGETHDVRIDFGDPAWFVRKRASPTEIGQPTSIQTIDSDWSATFRIEYAPPPTADLAGLPNADLVRHASVQSRMFNASGQAD